MAHTPGFTADHSLSKRSRHYKSLGGGFSAAALDGVVAQLKCLDWHCQGTECICIRITTEQVVGGGNVGLLR